MNMLTHTRLAPHHHDLLHEAYPPWMQQKDRLLSSQGPARPSFCPVILNPHQQAGCICSDNNEDTHNLTTSKQIKDYIDGGKVDFNCTNNVNGSISDMTTTDTFYQFETEMIDLEMLASLWSPKCCFTKDEVQKYWWKDQHEHRNGVEGKKGLVIKGVLGVISIISSFTLIWMLRRSHDGLSTTNNRVLLGLCISDIIYSISFVHVGMFVPKELGYWSWNARGNMVTCHLDGFFTVFGGGLGPFYNASLCVLFLAIVKYDKSDEYIRMKIEPFLHAVPLLMAFGFYVSILLVGGDVNPDGAGSCHMIPYNPPHCKSMNDGSTDVLFADIPCGRGNAKIGITLSLTIIDMIIPPIVMITCLTSIHRCVLVTEKSMCKYGARSISKGNSKKNKTSSNSLGILGLLKQYIILPCSSCKKGQPSTSSQPDNTRRLSNSRLVMYKGVAYSCSWLLSWGSMLIIIFFQLIQVKGHVAFLYAVTAFLPLQGLYNLAIYMHPKILAAKRSRRENVSWCKAITKAFWSKGLEKRMKRGRRSVPKMAGTKPADKTKRPKSDSMLFVESSDGIRGTAHTRPLRMERMSRTKICEEEEVQQEIRAPRGVTYLSFGRQSNTSASDSLTPPIPLHGAVLDAMVEDSEINVVDMNGNDPIEPIMSERKDELFDHINPIMMEGGSNHRFLCIVNDGNGSNDEENVLPYDYQ